jgi:hypothetical protein
MDKESNAPPMTSKVEDAKKAFDDAYNQYVRAVRESGQSGISAMDVGGRATTGVDAAASGCFGTALTLGSAGTVGGTFGSAGTFGTFGSHSISARALGGACAATQCVGTLPTVGTQQCVGTLPTIATQQCVGASLSQSSLMGDIGQRASATTGTIGCAGTAGTAGGTIGTVACIGTYGSWGVTAQQTSRGMSACMGSFPCYPCGPCAATQECWAG